MEGVANIKLTKAQEALLREVAASACRQAGARPHPAVLTIQVCVDGSSRTQCANRLVDLGLLRRRGRHLVGLGTPFCLTDESLLWLDAHKAPSP